MEILWDKLWCKKRGVGKWCKIYSERDSKAIDNVSYWSKSSIWTCYETSYGVKSGVRKGCTYYSERDSKAIDDISQWLKYNIWKSCETSYGVRKVV